MTHQLLTRREAIQTSVGALLASAGTLAFAQNSAPSAPVDVATVIFGFPAGGSTGLTARLVSDRLVATGYARTASVADSRPGAVGRIACEAVKNAPPDGTRMLLTPIGLLSIYPHVFKQLGYDSFTDFAPVSLASRMTFAFAVGPAVPASVTTIPEFLDWAKRNPDKATYGSPGAGSGPHMIGAALGLKAGVELRHAAYKGAQPGVADMVGGHLSAMAAATSDVLEYFRAGKIRILATTGDKRTPFTPAVPTIAEVGFPELTSEDYFGFFLPAATPARLVNAANAAVNKAVADPAVIQTLAGQGLEARGSTPDEVAQILRRDFAFWGALVKKLGFTAES